MHAFDILKYFSISLVALITLAGGAAVAEDTPLMEPEQLKAQLDQPQIVILDVRIVSDWRKSDRKITGATRVDPHDVSSWVGDFKKDALVVVYCA